MILKFNKSLTSNQGEPLNPASSTISASGPTTNKDEPPVPNAQLPRILPFPEKLIMGLSSNKYEREKMSEEVCSWTLKDRLGHYHLRCYLENEPSFLRRLKTGPKITTDIKLRID